MAALKKADSKKWINALVAIAAILLGYICISFFEQLNDWFALESKVASFEMIAQGLGITIGLVTFILITRNVKAKTYLDEVYGELVKVIWPENDSTIKLTVGIIIAVAISAVVLGIIDYLVRKLFGLLD